MRSKNLIIISPTAPPEVCGVSDYSFKLLKELSRNYDSIQVGVQKMPVKLNEEITKNVVIHSWERLLTKAMHEVKGTDVIFNYTPLSYSKIGFPKKLIVFFKKFKSSNINNRLFVFVHETWNGNKDLRFHHKLRDKIIKYSLKKIVSLADGILVLTEEQQQKISNLSGKLNIHLSFVGSNILPSAEIKGLDSQRIKGQWIIFGLAHTRVWALQTHLSLLKELYKCGIVKTIRTIGPVNNEYGLKEKTLSNEHFDNNFLVQLGVLIPEEISIELLKAEASLTGQTADSLRKSGTFAAMAAHAVPVICEMENFITNPPYQSVFQPKEILHNPNFFASEEGIQRQKLLHSWFWSSHSWKVIGDDIYAWMS